MSVTSSTRDMSKCECEHIAHASKQLTPYGNPGHTYGVKFSTSYMEKIKTPSGTFNVCKDCARDCLDNFRVQPRIAKEVIQFQVPDLLPTMDGWMEAAAFEDGLEDLKKKYPIENNRKEWQKFLRTVGTTLDAIRKDIDERIDKRVKELLENLSTEEIDQVIEKLKGSL